MLRRLVRSYYRLRYFPRVLFERLTGIADAVASLHRSESALMAAHEERLAGLHRYEAELIDQLMSAHEERLARIHEEFVAFCDDAIRAMMTVSTKVADIDRRMAAVQHGLQRLDNGTVDVQRRLATLQQSAKHRQDPADQEPTDHAATTGSAEPVRYQAEDDGRLGHVWTEASSVADRV